MKKGAIIVMGVVVALGMAYLVLMDRSLTGVYEYRSKQNIHADLTLKADGVYEICYRSCRSGRYVVDEYDFGRMIRFEAAPMREFGQAAGAVFESGDKSLGDVYRFTIDAWPTGSRIVNDGGGEDDYDLFQKTWGFSRRPGGFRGIDMRRPGAGISEDRADIGKEIA